MTILFIACAVALIPLAGTVSSNWNLDRSIMKIRTQDDF